MCLNVSDIAIIIVKGVAYCCIILNVSKSEAIHLSEMLSWKLKVIYKKCMFKKSILKVE